MDDAHGCNRHRNNTDIFHYFPHKFSFASALFSQMAPTFLHEFLSGQSPQVSLRLLNYETSWIEITVETAVGGGELQHAVVRVSDTSRVVLLVAIVPDHFFRSGISQYLHRTSEHHALKPLASQK